MGAFCSLIVLFDKIINRWNELARILLYEPFIYYILCWEWTNPSHLIKFFNRALLQNYISFFFLLFVQETQCCYYNISLFSMKYKWNDFNGVFLYTRTLLFFAFVQIRIRSHSFFLFPLFQIIEKAINYALNYAINMACGFWIEDVYFCRKL